MKYGINDRIKFLWNCTREYRLRLLVIYIFSLVDSFSDSARNIVFAIAVSTLVSGKPFTEILKIYGIQTIVILSFAFIAMIYYRYLCRVEGSIKAKLQQEIMSKILKSSIDFSENNDSGVVQQNMDSVINMTFNVFVDFIPSLLYNITNVIISLVILTRVSIFLGLLILVVIPLFILIQKTLGSTFDSLMGERNKTFKKLLSTVSNTFNMATFIKSHGNSDIVLNETKEIFVTDAENKAKVFAEVNSVNELMNIIMVMFRSIIDIGGAYLLSTSVIGIGTFTLIHNYAKDTFRSIRNTLKAFARLSNTLSTLDMIMDLIATPYEKSGSVDLDTIDSIEFENISFSYDNKNIIDNLSCTLTKGKKYAFVGYSGCGKSTMLSLVNGIRKITSGIIKVNNINMDYINQSTYRQMIGVVPQTGLVFNGTIRDNITYGCENISDNDIWEAIDKANLTEFISSLPDKLDTTIGENGMKLSGGQRQRITIARAFIRKPQLLIFDEATSALDNKSEAEVQKAIDNISNDVTVLIVAHRLSTVKNVDKIFCLDNGKIVEEGDYNELISKEGFFYSLSRKRKR
nr:MAG TPA: ABC-type multidrug transport system, ATPase and permease component [Caudoviricetes sp.]